MKKIIYIMTLVMIAFLTSASTGFTKDIEALTKPEDQLSNAINREFFAPAVPYGVGIVVVKTADPVVLPEPGGGVAFTVVVTNSGGAQTALVLDSLVDDIHGDLNGQGNCSVPQTIQYGASYTCQFTGTVLGNAGYIETDTVTAIGHDACCHTVSASDDATVTITDVLPTVDLVKDVTPSTLPEPGGDFNYTLTIYNTSPEPVTITALVDDNPLPAVCTDLIGLTLPVGGSASCTYTVSHSDIGVYPNTASVTVEDDDGNSASDSDNETVIVTNVPPEIDVIKTADPTVVQEPGGEVTFTVVVTNNSRPTDPVTIDSLMDDIHGNLNGKGTCSVPQTIQPGASYTCEFTAIVQGDAGDTEVDTVTASGYDDEETPVSDWDDATVTIVVNDGLPEIDVVKTADPTIIQEPGGEVTFTVVVTNNSEPTDPVTITSLEDDIYGDLDGQGTCSVPQTIQPGASYTCEFTAMVEGNAGNTETDTVTASGQDDEGNKVSDSDDATVVIVGSGDNDLPEIEVVKTADPTIIQEPGGEVTFTVVVTNNSEPTDPVIITSLEDDIHGDLDGQGTCSVPQTIQPGASYTCEFTAMVEGEAGDTETDTVTASGVDDEGNPVSDSDDATVAIWKALYKIYLPSAENEKSLSGVVPMTVGYEDLQFDREDMDFDYNDWVTNIDTKLVINEDTKDLYRIDFIVLPRARGGKRSHAYHINIPANTFATNGTATLTIKDQNGNVISSTSTPFDASQANDYNVIPCTCDAFPVLGQIVNAIEGTAVEQSQRTAQLSIEFYSPGPFDLSYLSEENISAPHGTGLFFDPYIYVNAPEGGFEIHQGDLRLLSVPEITWMWPEERVRIDEAYPDVFGDPPDFTFPDGWWKNHNTCVYGDGIKCPSALMGYMTAE
jgi:LruC domain-containing protein